MLFNRRRVRSKRGGFNPRAALLVLAMLLVCVPAGLGGGRSARADDRSSNSAGEGSDGRSGEPQPSWHIVGWLNTALPGAGQFLLGNPLRGSAELVGETGITYFGYRLSPRSPFTLDGVPEQLPQFANGLRRNSSLTNLNTPLYADMLQEVGIKAHCVDVFLAYREAARRDGRTAGIDQSSALDLFLDPFKGENLSNPWVWGAMAAVAAATIVDYRSNRNTGSSSIPRLDAYSNFLYSVNYEAWQPIGSGAPEEMFYRGFLQHELYSFVHSPFFSIPLTAAAFAFSHAPGQGRISAAAAGTYLGFLAHKYDGRLGPGITLHFWSVVMLGIETVLLSHDAQHTTPPATLAVQINY